MAETALIALFMGEKSAVLVCLQLTDRGRCEGEKRHLNNKLGGFKLFLLLMGSDSGGEGNLRLGFFYFALYLIRE